MDLQIMKRATTAGAEPTWNGEHRYWSVPQGWRHPSCPGCGHVYYSMRPQLSVGGASVLGPQCRWCNDELQAL